MKSKPAAGILLGTALLTVLILPGCSKDKNDDNIPSLSKDKVRATITLSKEFLKAEGDVFSTTVSGIINTTGTYTDWNVNGQKKTGTSIEIGTDDFNGGKTIVIESVSEVVNGSISLSGFESGTTPFTVTYKIEKGSKILDEGTAKIVVDQDPLFIKNISLGN